MMFSIGVTLGLAVVVSAWLTGRFRQFAIARGLLDVPNARSSHTTITPRGGGVAIVLGVVAGVITLALLTVVPWSVAAALGSGGALVAIVGFIDDRGHIAPLPRLVGHFAGACCVLALLRAAPTLPVLGSTLSPGVWSYALAALYLVWVLNLTNFMDGIDGIAGVEVVTVCIGAIVTARLASANATELWALPALVACATLGFLRWNWPPAKIFMGDAGSGFLGLIVAALSLRAAMIEPRLLWCWLIVLGVFIVDATITLLRRILRRQKFYQAHRSHAYQHAANQCRSHQRVTVAVALINLLWLLPMASMVAIGRVDGATGLAIAYVPLACVALWLRAGLD